MYAPPGLFPGDAMNEVNFSLSFSTICPGVFFKKHKIVFTKLQSKILKSYVTTDLTKKGCTVASKNAATVCRLLIVTLVGIDAYHLKEMPYTTPER